RHRGRPVRAGTLGLALAGGVLIGVGAAAMIAADLGVTPWDVLTTAVADRADVTVGVAGAALSIAVYLACAPFGRLPGWGNLVLLVAVAGAVDAALATFGAPDALAGRLALYGAGVPVVCLGVALIVRADIGVGPLEMVMLVATDRSVPLVAARLVDPRESHRCVSPARFAAGRRPRRRSRWLRLPPASSPATNLARRYIHVTSASAR
ncbi:MAG TPA: hypothetical protein VGJ43_14390, partial [Acidimicrobiales bacterium]